MTSGDYYNAIITLMRFSLIAQYIQKDEWLTSLFDMETDLFWEDYVWLTTRTRGQ